MDPYSKNLQFLWISRTSWRKNLDTLLKSGGNKWGGGGPPYGRLATLTLDKFYPQGLKMVFSHYILFRNNQKELGIDSKGREID